MIIQRRSFWLTFILLAITTIGIATNNSLFFRIAVLLLFMICIIRGTQESYILNPYFFFSLTPLSLLIYRNISRYHLELTTSVWALGVINMAAFIAALELTPEYTNIYKCYGAGDENVLRRNTFFLLFLSMIPWVYQTATGSVVPMAYVFSLFIGGVILCAFKSKKKYLILIVTLACVLMSLRYVTKSSVLTYVIAYLIGYEKYYADTRKKKIRLLILAIAAIVIMIASFSFANQGRSNLNGSDEVLQYYRTYGSLQWEGNSAFMMPYMYLTTPWSNLQYVINTQNTRTYGLWLIKPLLGYMQIDGLFDNFYALKAYSNFNTFTFIAYHFKDFGYWGTWISSILLGIFVKKVYSRFTISKSPLDAACYLFTGQAVLEMFFSNEFFTQSFPFTIVITMGIYKFLFCRNNEIEIEDMAMENVQ